MGDCCAQKYLTDNLCRKNFFACTHSAKSPFALESNCARFTFERGRSPFA